MGKKSTLRWLFWLIWIAGGLYFADKGASYYREARALPRSVIETIPEMSPHRAGDRVLVFAPHPDDEAIGCAGMIQQAVAAGAQVWVVYMTNGDGFRLAVEQQYRLPKPTPEQHIQFGELRQQEARHAMRLLGLADWRTIFLGYSDRGLYLLWSSNWTVSNALRSYYTGTDSNPYRDTLRPGATYCGQNVLRDVETVLRRTVPTHVYVTHPADDHSDHAATALFVQTALARLREQGIGFARSVVLRHYLVHCGDWPQPQGMHPDEPLTPPVAFLNIGLHWKRLTLTSQQQATKLKAIQAHASQMRMMSRFLQSFVRENELFIEQPVALQLAPVQGIVWEEPDEEDLLRELQAPGDFSWGRLYLEHGRLIVHLSTRGKPRTGFTYSCTAHVLLPNDNITTVTLRAKVGKHNASAQVDEDGVTFRFPSFPSGSVVTLHAQSRFAGLPVDKSIGRVVRLP
ncbi:MAG: hypothetical protein KatS3mg022_2261 [Armatimonadota bacterium]|nr:MAG: hypothetical protein KatS3mg022_2261 [Armatimonadota bacterium]